MYPCWRLTGFSPKSDDVEPDPFTDGGVEAGAIAEHVPFTHSHTYQQVPVGDTRLGQQFDRQKQKTSLDMSSN